MRWYRSIRLWWLNYALRKRLRHAASTQSREPSPAKPKPTLLWRLLRKSTRSRD